MMKPKENRIAQAPRVEEVKTVFRGALTIEEARIKRFNSKDEPVSYSRQRINRVDASAVFIYNKDSGAVVLTRQFRYAIVDKVKAPILEIMAGKVDPGESPSQTALRESLEECGYRISPEKLIHLVSVFASPGYTAEKYHLFYAEVASSDKLTEGGGLENENEDIEVVEMPLAEFQTMVSEGLLEDSKTLLAYYCSTGFIG